MHMFDNSKFPVYFYLFYFFTLVNIFIPDRLFSAEPAPSKRIFLSALPLSKLSPSVNVGILKLALSGLTPSGVADDTRKGLSDGLGGLALCFGVSAGGDDAGDEEWTGRNGPDTFGGAADRMSLIKAFETLRRI